MASQANVHQVRFGAFALDLQTAELRDNGREPHASGAALSGFGGPMEHPGQLVTSGGTEAEAFACGYVCGLRSGAE